MEGRTKTGMKIWVDDVRPAPDGYVWVKSVNEAELLIVSKKSYENMINSFDGGLRKLFEFDNDTHIELIDIDHDAGEYASDGGDYIKLLDWLEEKGYNIPIHIHSMNPVGVANMRRIIQRNGWIEV